MLCTVSLRNKDIKKKQKKIKNAEWLTNVNQYATSVKWASYVYIVMWNLKLLSCTKENFEEDNPKGSLI